MNYPENYSEQYYIEGAVNLDTHDCFKDPEYYPNFQQGIEEFKELLITVTNGLDLFPAWKTFYKFGDGDYHFLKQEGCGSAAPGARALSKNYSEINHEQFVSGAQLCDFYTCELYAHNRSHFEQVIDKNIDFPAEYGYGLVANKWLLETFSGEIGLIGGKEKIQLIKKLMSSTEYQEYLGIEKFEDYIEIPQKFACDDIEETEAMVAQQLEQSSSKIFLFIFFISC